MVRILEVRERKPLLIEQLLQVWENSVRATHLFLSEGEIVAIREFVPQALNGIAHLFIAEREAGRPVAFMGLEKEKLEMLFVSPEERGKGLGKRLLQYGLSLIHILDWRAAIRARRVLRCSSCST